LFVLFVRNRKWLMAESCSEICETYDAFLSTLAALVTTRTVTTDEAGLTAGIEWCRARFAAALEPRGWTVQLDASDNVECLPPVSQLNAEAPALWLCAHVDTVDAVAARWVQRDPFVATRCATHLTGRGVNDCKAGVAFMVHLAEAIGRGTHRAFNGGFLVTRREESGSALPRTSPEFARGFSCGRLFTADAPHKTFVQCLENTVSLRGARPVGGATTSAGAADNTGVEPPSSGAQPREYADAEIGVYDRERHSIVVVVTAPLAVLTAALRSVLPTVEGGTDDWKFVAVWPAASAAARQPAAGAVVGDAAGDTVVVAVATHAGGHSCSVRNADNVLFNAIFTEGVESCAADAGGASGGAHDHDALLFSGRRDEATRVAPTLVTARRRARSGAAAGAVKHGLLLNYRGLAPIDDVWRTVDALRAAVVERCATATVEVSPDSLGNGTGADQRAFFAGSHAATAVASAADALAAHHAARRDAASRAAWTCAVCLGAPQAKPLCACAAPCLPGLERAARAPAAKERPRRTRAPRPEPTGLTQLYEPNPGRSDASHIWRNLPAALRGAVVVPFTCGPGHRSHRDERAGRGYMRKTHGVNEGFHIAIGEATLPFFLLLVDHFPGARC
jgi:hypothetical protein